MKMNSGAMNKIWAQKMLNKLLLPHLKNHPKNIQICPRDL